MDIELFESLLHEEEGILLDFKSEQYLFDGSSHDKKSELLKDILAFANTWRDSTAYILIGVKEVQGAKSDVVGVTEHLADSNIQQFVGSKTQKSVNFSCSIFSHDGKKVDVIEIPPYQNRPIYLNRDYGKTKKNMVYFRKGSSTKEATPQEIYDMAIEDNKLNEFPQLELRLFDLYSEEEGKSSVTVVSQPFSNKLSKDKINNTFLSILASFILFFNDRKNKNFASEVIEYTAKNALLSPLGFELMNTSEVLGENICFKGNIAKEDDLVIQSSLPMEPRRVIQDEFIYDNSHDVNYITERKSEWQINAELGDIRPGESFVTEPLIYVGSAISKTITIEGYLYGNKITDPVPCELEVVIEAEEPRSMTKRDVKEYFGRV